jgi:cell division septal protein FtsQ
LNINITERVPAARVDIDGTLSFMDTAGVIFPQRTGMLLDVPIVYGLTKSIDGKDIIDTAAVHEVLPILRSAGTSDAISVIRRLPTGEIQFETNGCAVPVRFGTPDDGKEKMRVFRTFLPQLLLHGEQYAEYIDVRFHDQVVVRWKDSLGIN